MRALINVLDGCDEDLIAAYRATIERLRALGAAINDVSLPYRDAWIPANLILHEGAADTAVEQATL